MDKRDYSVKSVGITEKRGIRRTGCHGCNTQRIPGADHAFYSVCGNTRHQPQFLFGLQTVFSQYRHIQRIDQKQIPDCGENLFRRVASVEFDSAENHGSCSRIHAEPTAPQRGLAGCRHRKVTTVLFRLTVHPAKFEIESACRSLFVSRASADRGRPVGCRGH